MYSENNSTVELLARIVVHLDEHKEFTLARVVNDRLNNLLIEKEEK